MFVRLFFSSLFSPFWHSVENEKIWKDQSINVLQFHMILYASIWQSTSIHTAIVLPTWLRTTYFWQLLPRLDDRLTVCRSTVIWNHSRKRYKQSLNFKTSGNFEANWSNSKRYAPCVWTLDSVDASVSFCAYVFRMALSWFIGATEQRWRLLLAKIRWHTALRKLHNFLGVFFFCFIHLRSTPCRLGQSNYIWFNE